MGFDWDPLTERQETPGVRRGGGAGRHRRKRPKHLDPLPRHLAPQLLSGQTLRH